MTSGDNSKCHEMFWTSMAMCIHSWSHCLNWLPFNSAGFGSAFVQDRIDLIMRSVGGMGHPDKDRERIDCLGFFLSGTKGWNSADLIPCIRFYVKAIFRTCFVAEKRASLRRPFSMVCAYCYRLAVGYAASISRRSAMSMRTRSRALSMPRALRFLSMWAIIICASS